MASRRLRFRISAPILAVAVTSCATWDRGADPAGRRLQAQAQVHVVAAAESFRKDSGRYPKSLEELAPDLSWLPSDGRLSYRQTEAGYSVTLDYTPSWPQLGRSSCHHTSAAEGW